MTRTVILAAAACLLLAAASAFAQTKTDFSGDWTLDMSKSKINNVESGSMNVTQNDNAITFKIDFKRAQQSEGGGGMGRGGMMGGNQAMTYSLDGKETSMEVPGPQGTTATAKLKSKWDGAKLKLTSTRSFNTQMGEITVTTKETWELLDGGKALKIIRDMETPRGTQTNEFYYTRK